MIFREEKFVRWNEVLAYRANGWIVAATWASGSGEFVLMYRVIPQ